MGYDKTTINKNYTDKTGQNKESGKPVATRREKTRKIKINPLLLIGFTGCAVIAATAFVLIKLSIKEDNDFYYNYCRHKVREYHEGEKYRVFTPVPSGKVYDNLSELEEEVLFNEAEENRLYEISLAFDKKTGQLIVIETYAKGR